MYLKRKAIPRTWAIERKAEPWAVNPRGPWPKELSLPLSVILRDNLKLVASMKEAKKVLQSGKIKVNGKVIKDPKYGAGLFDRISVENVGDFSIYLEGKKLRVKPIPAKLLKTKPCKVLGKKLLKGAKLQINLFGGLNFLIKPTEKITANDSVLVDLEKNLILKVLKPVKGNWALIMKGKHIGKLAEIVNSNKVVEVKIDGKEVRFSKDSLYLIDATEVEAIKNEATKA